MNLIDSSFLCLDIGTSGVRGIAHHIKDANFEKSAFFTCDSYDTMFALTTVIDELEKQIGSHFDTAYITGNFGPSCFDLAIKNTLWSNEHKITTNDIRNQITRITTPDGFSALHLIPLRYDTPHKHNTDTPVGFIEKQLISMFGAIFYSHQGIYKIHE